MDITIIGLGYVGAVSAACLAASGHRVCGVDINPAKVDALNAGDAPVTEPGLQELISRCLEEGRLAATCDAAEALSRSDVCFVSVATPSTRGGGIDDSHLLRAVREIALALAKSGRQQVVAIRSSVLPSVVDAASQILEQTAPGLADLCVNPEFLREGSAISDYLNPPFTILGCSSGAAEEALRGVYANIAATVVVLQPKEAMMVKYACNAFHGTKVAFANEIGALCSEIGVDGSEVMRVFCLDTKLNVSARYLAPGFAFGGSCLPKDLRAIAHLAKNLDIDLPMLRGVLDSNRQVVERALQRIREFNPKRIGLVGLSFKTHTDDLRESPFVELAERLIGKGFSLRIYDPNVYGARLTGANRRYIETAIPHLASLLVPTLDELAAQADLVIVGHQIDGVAELCTQAALFSWLNLSTGESHEPHYPVAGRTEPKWLIASL